MQKHFRSNATSINVSVSLDDLPFCINEILENNLFYSICICNITQIVKYSNQCKTMVINIQYCMTDLKMTNKTVNL